jgi:hypothetical protein
MRMRTRWILAGVALGTTAGVAAARARDWYVTWGVDRDERTKALPGDEIVTEPTGGETRGITIDAPPAAVWPWLVQMGYGRAGWYSYDQLDQRGKSADEVVPAWGGIAVGDVLPTHPGGGFEVAVLEPERALVLRSDTAIVEAQEAAARVAGEGPEAATAGVQASGAFLSGMPRDFAASWAFVLEPLGEDRTRLIERFRVRFGDTTGTPPFVLPLLGFGVFVMLQKQMQGIRRRAERLTHGEEPPADTIPEPIAAVA